MKNQTELLILYLCEQISLEEHLLWLIESRASEINEKEYADAKNLLSKTKLTLQKHYAPLNMLVDKLEESQKKTGTRNIFDNGKDIKSLFNSKSEKVKTSAILRDIYSALNLITISNTRLHTTALALNNTDIAETALRHLENLAPFVVEIEELVPQVITRELQSESFKVDPSVAQKALKNIMKILKRNI